MNKLDRSKKSIIYKFGRDIKVSYKVSNDRDKQIDFGFTKLERNPMRFLNKGNRDPFEPLKFRIASRNLFESRCVNCNSTENIEMHHIKHIKTINTKLNSFDKMVAAINRKQVPLCRVCHVKLHAGEYRGVKIKRAK